MHRPNKKRRLESSNRIPHFLRNVLANWLGTLSSIILAFFLSPFVIHHLGVTAYGIWVLIASLTGYLGLLDLGVRGAVTRYIAKFHAQSKHQESSHIVSSALVIFALVGTVAFAVSLLAALIVPKVVHVPANMRSTVQLVTVLAGASIASTLVSNVFGAIVVGLQHFEIANIIEVGSGIVRSLMILLALRHGHGLVALGTINIAFSIIVGLLYAWMSRRLYPQLRVGYRLADRSNIYLILSFGGFLCVLNVSTYLILYTDSVVISSFLSVAMVTFFAIAGNLITYSRSLVTGISTTVTPLASALEAEGKQQDVQRVGLAGPRYATMLVLPIVIVFLCRGKTFIGLWMGTEYADLSSKVLQILSLALSFSAANQVATSMMIGINKHRPVVLANIVEGLLNLTLSISLVHRMGIMGVAWGTSIPSFVTSLVFWPMFIRRVFGLSWTRYVLSTWIRPFLSILPFALISLYLDRHWRALNVWMFFGQVLLSLPVAIVGFWFGCLSHIERRSYLERLFSSAVQVGEMA